MGRVIIISNRVLDLKKAAQAGGVAVALADVMARHDGIWIGWNGQIVAEGDVPPPPPRRRGSRIVSTALTQAEHAGFYLGYSNSVLWPVMHNRLDLAQFEAGYFSIYSEVNRRFAQLVKSVVAPDDLIWVHDYQFIPLGLELRKLGLRNPIGFFLHIPFPPVECFLAVPEHREIAEAFASYDLVGLQTRADVSNMLGFLQQGTDGRVLNDGRIRAFERIMSIESMPIGIDPVPFEQARPSHLHVQGGSHVSRIVGVDRLDYSKGLPQKLRAYDRFLEMAPEYRQRVVLTQIAPPTRESVEAYSDIRKELEALSGSINGRFGELDWVPIHYIHRPIARSKLADIYRASRVCLVTPLRDGMNLVAKEYVASQDETDPGVLILSRFAGAAEQLDAALIVNPYNIEEIANAIRTALQMSKDERCRRHTALLAMIRSNSVTTWGDHFLERLSELKHVDNPPISSEHADRYDAALTKLENWSTEILTVPARGDRARCDVDARGGKQRRGK